MRKDIILLTSSKKHGNYCTAGIDIRTGEWVRIVSDDESIQYATTLGQMTYENGERAQILDIISIECKGRARNYYQPENYIMDDEYYWDKIGTATIHDVLRIHPPEVKPCIFYDNNYSIPHDYFNELYTDMYSLVLIAPQNPMIEVTQWPTNKSITMTFDYNCMHYRFFRITDTFGREYLNKDEGLYKLPGNYVFIISLGELHTDNKHYKLIAKVFRI